MPAQPCWIRLARANWQCSYRMGRRRGRAYHRTTGAAALGSVAVAAIGGGVAPGPTNEYADADSSRPDCTRTLAQYTPGAALRAGRLCCDRALDSTQHAALWASDPGRH